MIRRPPRSTLFPTRRSSDLSPGWSAARRSGTPTPANTTFPDPIRRSVPSRSEDHTSELQSRRDLVCRLLLEKKKKKKSKKKHRPNPINHKNIKIRNHSQSHR